MRSRAVVMTDDRTMELREVEVPDPLPEGFALLRVEGNGICGSDYDLYRGSLRNIGMVKYPVVPGHEMVGRVIRTTPEASETMGATEGARVGVESFIRCGHCKECASGRGNFCRNVFYYSSAPLALSPGNGLSGGMADYLVLRPGTTLYTIPDDLSVQDAVLFNPFSNAVHWVCEVGEVRFGDRVLILGGGQRGLACVVAAKESGASQIIMTGLRRDSHKLRLANDLGATATVNVDDEDVQARVRELTDGELVDLAVDVVPNSTQSIVDAIEVLRPQGTLVLAGVKGRPIEGLVTDRIWQKGLRIRGAIGVSRWSSEKAVDLISKDAYPLASLHTHTFGLEEVERAIQIVGNEITGEDPIHVTVVP